MGSIPTALADFDPAKVEAKAATVSSQWLNYAGGDRYFALWLAIADRHVARKIGLGIMDLADICYRDLYDDGVSPKDAAAEAISRAV